MKAALNKIDLNLLKVLHVLIEEQNVTHAAERLFLAQPSVSRKLRKLREQLDDELFVSTPQGMKPTYRCNQIAESLPDLIALLEKTLIPVKKFDVYSHPVHLKKIVEFEYLSECRFAIAQLAEWNEKEGMMENMLVQRGLNYNEIFRSEIISNVAAVAAQTEALFSTSELYIDNTHNLVEVSHAKLPSFNSKQILLYQHKRTESDPFYLWLHENIVQLVDGLGWSSK